MNTSQDYLGEQWKKELWFDKKKVYIHYGMFH